MAFNDVDNKKIRMEPIPIGEPYFNPRLLRLGLFIIGSSLVVYAFAGWLWWLLRR